MKKEELIEYINQGLSTREMALLYNVTYSTICYWLNKFKFKTNHLRSNSIKYLIPTKFCPICKQTKSRQEFYTFKKIYQSSYCKACTNKNKVIKNKQIYEYSPFSYTIRNVKNRLKDFDLDKYYLKEIWEQQKGICPYTNIKLELPTHKNIIHPTIRASLDRIDSSKGYVRGNVQFISTSINYMKGELTDAETKCFINTIVNNLSKNTTNILSQAH